MGTFIVADFVSTDKTAPRVRHPFAADTFDREAGPLGKTPVGGFPWFMSYGGQFTAVIESRTARLTIGTTGAGTARIDDGQTDGIISVTLAEIPGFAGIIFRGLADNFTGYIFYVDAGAYRFRRKTGVDSYAGDYTIANSPVPAPGDVMEAVLNGPKITLKVNGTTIAEFNDSTYTGTAKGMFVRNSSARFDNFRSDQLP